MSKSGILKETAYVAFGAAIALTAMPAMSGSWDYGSILNDVEAMDATTHQHQNDIVTIAAGSGSFDTLLVAVKEAGLEDTLRGAGPFTVFAPTDEAFARIPKAQLKELLGNKAALTEVLTYHVIAGKVMASEVMSLDSAKTVQGQSVQIDTVNGVRVDGANVIKTDIVASNGVIHVIDRVIMPN